MNILIIGTTEDDVSYIKTKMEVEKIDVIANDIEVFVGKYASRDIAICATGNGEMLSAMVTGICIEMYKPYLCINVGNVHSFGEELKQKDIFVANRIYLGNVNQMPLGRLSYGQISDLKAFFTSDNILEEQIYTANSKLANNKIVHGVLISDDLFRTDPAEMDEMIEKHYTRMDNMCACDSSSGGFCVACTKSKIPFFIIKVCAYELGNKDQLITRQRMGLSVQPYVGKLIAAAFEQNK